jgi:hypothetical protein
VTRAWWIETGWFLLGIVYILGVVVFLIVVALLVLNAIPDGLVEVHRGGCGGWTGADVCP